MNLHVYIDGIERICEPYRVGQAPFVAKALADAWYTLSEYGRVSVFVTEGNIAWIIAGGK